MLIAEEIFDWTEVIADAISWAIVVANVASLFIASSIFFKVFSTPGALLTRSATFVSVYVFDTSIAFVIWESV